MENLKEFSSILTPGNPIAWAFVAAVAFALSTILKGALGLLASKWETFSKKTENQWDDMAVEAIRKLRGWIVFFWFFYLGIRSFETNARLTIPLRHFVMLMTLLQVGMWGFHFIRAWKDNFLRTKFSNDTSSAAAIGLLYAAIQGMLFITIFLLALSNMGVDIAALLAGLGVGGIAVALAAQNILGDLLASLSIVLDKPFVIGDFILVGEKMGTVEQIGVKTTRLRSISGEELIFSNKDLLESRIQNYKRMWERRVVQSVGVTYDTPLEKLKAVPKWIRSAVEGSPGLRFDRCNFSKFADSSLNFEFVFWVSNPDYNAYMDLQEKVLLGIFDKFTQEKVEFAFPTQTIHLQNVSPEKMI